MRWVEVVEMAAVADAVQAAAAVAVQAGWEVPKPPGREAPASVPTVTTVNHTWWVCPATTSGAPSAAHRWSASKRPQTGAQRPSRAEHPSKQGTSLKHYRFSTVVC